MRKIISIVILAAMLLSLLSMSLIAFATDIVDQTEEAPATKIEDALYFSCSYNADTRKVTVNGSMNHDAFAAYGNSTLVIYAIPPGMSEYDVANDSAQEPLAQTAVSIRFGFSFKISKLIERYSRYAIFLRSEDGELLLATEAQYPEVVYERNTEQYRDYFKGVATDNILTASDANVATAIIPVYLDVLFTKTSDGYVYNMEEEQLFFSRAYIDKLDAKINSVSSSGARVYLQFLLRGGEDFGVSAVEGAEYYLPNVYEENIVLLVHSATEFLSLRYKNADLGNVYGIIVGKGWDNYSKYNYSTADSIEHYIDQCALYSVIITNAARSVIPSLDIVLPFTSENFINNDSFFGVQGKSYSVKYLIEGFLGYFDESFAHGLDCSFIMETSDVPFGISNENIEDGVNLTFLNYNTQIYAGGQKLFSEYCAGLSALYESAPESYIFRWIVPENLSGTALSVAYVYSYYSLICDDMVSCFVVDVPTQKDVLSHISLVMKYIDTERGLPNNANMLQYFGVSSWSDLVGAPLEDILAKKHIYSTAANFDLPTDIKGRFDYFDFFGSILTDGWNHGIGCKSIKIDYAETAQKALKAELALQNNQYAQIIYSYPQHENMTYTPYLAFDIKMSDGLDDSLYEVKIFLENSDTRLESTCVVEGNELTSVVLDLSRYDHSDRIEQIKISVRSIYGEVENSTFLLYRISGHSSEHSSQELVQLINSEREKINNTQNEQKIANSFEKAAIAVGIAIIAGALAIGLFVSFKKGRSEE